MKIAGNKRPAKFPPSSGKKNLSKRQKPTTTATPGSAPTVKDIINDRLTPLANAYWALGQKSLRPYDAKVVEQIYKTELSGDDFKKVSSRAVLLEFSSYLENYLWKNFDAKASTPNHVMSIVMMVNEKFREGVPVWDIFHAHSQDNIGPFFNRVFALSNEKKMSYIEKTSMVLFLINCYSSLEDTQIRSCCMKFISLPMWRHLSKARLEENFRQNPKIEAAWKVVKRQDKKLESDFFPNLIRDFLILIEKKSLDKKELHYTERCMELLVDLLSQLPTRRFLRPLLVDSHFIVRCKLSKVFKSEGGRLLRQLLQMVIFYEAYGIDESEGTALTEKEIEVARHERIESMQGLAFKYFRKELESLILGSVSSMDTREGILKHLQRLSVPRLREFCERVGILRKKEDTSFMEVPETKEFLSEVFISSFEKRKSQRQEVSALPLYPSEEVLWDMNLVPEVNYHGDEVLALPKLNLQFLTIYDYLLRNFNLFRLESTYEIREDLKNVVHRLKPRVAGNGETVFTGWAKMAVPIKEFSITKVQKPNIGEIKPARVQAEVTIDLAPFQTYVREDWESIREHDVLFLLCVEGKHGLEEKVKKMSLKKQLNPKELGIKSVRGCEVRIVLDEEKSMIGERKKDGSVHVGVGDLRTYKVEMDTAQYQMDMTAVIDGEDDVNQTFNLLVKRKAKENNFKAVLETIRNLMSGQFVIPDWLHDVFLGYGDPGSATYHSVASPTWELKFADTFLDFDHLKSCFEHKYDVRVSAENNDSKAPPYRLQFYDQKERVEGIEADKPDGQNKKNNNKKGSKPELHVIPYKFEEPGPYPEDQPKRNKIRFTAKQVEAVRSGLNHGLTMIVGPPGTGKTDVAVQIMAELFQNNPKQRTLLVTHSNHALNDLFEKIMERDIDERYLLRMGRGEEELKTEKDFSKFGRVNYMLERRLHCLGEVARLAKSLGLPDDAGYTCETAAHFYLQFILARWEIFISQWDQFKKDGTKPDKIVAKQQPQESTTKAPAGSSVEEVEEEEEEEEDKKEEPKPTQVPEQVQDEKLGFVEEFFPFKIFFMNAPNEVFTGNDDTDIEKAWGCWRHLKNLFLELEECRPFEILRNYKDRGNYLISKHAKVIAMTCTHAAIRRGEFVRLNMQYDNLIMEEAAQILEIETFIPMLLQEHDKEFGCRLKRVVLLGDHHQLPPIIKNMAFQKYSHMDQSLFSRFIRLGTPHIQLNAQGRSRPSLAKIWNWRYKELGDLPHVLTKKEYLKANSGLSYEYQFVNVEDYNGKGCTSPMPYFYQNLAEAEYMVQVYMYMRLLGYPANTISMLTTYNGQKALIEDIVNQRCRDNPFFGPPARISTVDKYQGQQNDYILLSLVRSNTAGHIRDVRRLVVAMSRARLGLYVFGRENLFKNCFELIPAFNVLLKRPTKLCLNLQELTSLTERNVQNIGKVFQVNDMPHMGHIVSQMAQRAHQNMMRMHYLKQQEEEEKARIVEEESKKVAEKKRKEYAEQEASESTHAKGKDFTKKNAMKLEPQLKPLTAEKPNDVQRPANSSMEVEEDGAKVQEKSETAGVQGTNPVVDNKVSSSSVEATPQAQQEPAEKVPVEEEAKEPVVEPTKPGKPMSDFKSMKFRELQRYCKENGLKASGKKVELLKRIEESLNG